MHHPKRHPPGQSPDLLVALMAFLAYGFAASIAGAAPSTQSIAAPATSPLVLPQPEVKVHLLRAGLYLLVPVRINGEDAGLFALDTGATSVAVDSRLAERLRLPKITSTMMGTVGGDLPLTVHGVDEIRVGDAALRKTVVGAVNFERLRKQLLIPQLNGILGNSFLKTAPFRVVPWDASLTFYDPQHFVPPAGAVRETLRIRGAQPAVYMTVEQSFSGWAALDLGSNGTICFEPHCARQQAEWFESRTWSLDSNYGLAGIAMVRSIDVADVQVLGQRMTDIRSAFEGDPAKARFPAWAIGSIGMGLLQHFDLTFDYKSESLWAQFRPDAVPSEWDREAFDAKAADLCGCTPLMGASRLGRADYVERFLEAKADVNARDALGTTALHRAALSRNADIVSRLLQAGAQVNAATTENDTPLHWAADAGSAEVVRTLIAAGASLNATDMFGRTALIVACESARADVVPVLLKARADLTLQTPAYGSALHYAAQSGSVEIVRQLLDAGADPNCALPRQKGGNTPLMPAALRGHDAVIRLLTQRGARVNAVNADGQTALMAAANRAKTDAVRALLSAGADKTIRDRHGLTAIDYAADSANPVDMISLLYYGEQRPASSLHVEAVSSERETMACGP